MLAENLHGGSKLKFEIFFFNQNFIFFSCLFEGIATNKLVAQIRACTANTTLFFATCWFSLFTLLAQCEKLCSRDAVDGGSVSVSPTCFCAWKVEIPIPPAPNFSRQKKEQKKFWFRWRSNGCEKF